MASDPSLYTYSSPLQGYENLSPLPNELNEDGKSFKNPETGTLSESYNKFTSGVTNGVRGGKQNLVSGRELMLIEQLGFDVHIYYYQNNEEQTSFAKALWERIRREFPELRIYRFWDKPVGYDTGYPTPNHCFYAKDSQTPYHCNV